MSHIDFKGMFVRWGTFLEQLQPTIFSLDFFKRWHSTDVKDYVYEIISHNAKRERAGSHFHPNSYSAVANQ